MITESLKRSGYSIYSNKKNVMKTENLKLYAGITSTILMMITGKAFKNEWISTQEIVSQLNYSHAHLFGKITVEDVEAILDAASHHGWFHTHMENGKITMINPNLENITPYSEWLALQIA